MKTKKFNEVQEKMFEKLSIDLKKLIDNLYIEYEGKLFLDLSKFKTNHSHSLISYEDFDGEEVYKWFDLHKNSYFVYEFGRFNLMCKDYDEPSYEFELGDPNCFISGLITKGLYNIFEHRHTGNVIKSIDIEGNIGGYRFVLEFEDIMEKYSYPFSGYIHL